MPQPEFTIDELPGAWADGFTAADQGRTPAFPAAADPADPPPWHHVRVHWPDGTSHMDGIRGWDEQHAIDAAQWNWGTANPHGTCERVEYLGPEAEGDADGWFSSGADAAHQAYLDDLGHVNDDAAGAEA